MKSSRRLNVAPLFLARSNRRRSPLFPGRAFSYGSRVLLAILAWPVATSRAQTFTVADVRTGSTAFTGSNGVAVVSFAAPDGYDRYQIGEGQTFPGGAWLDVAPPPKIASFALPASDGTIVLTAWFTNSNASVALESAAADIYFTTATPVPAVRTSLTRTSPGSSVRITGEDLDDGSTGGTANETELAIFRLSSACLAVPEADATPGDPFVSLTNAAEHAVSLIVMNEAGNVATSATSCAVSFLLADDPPAGHRYVSKNNVLEAHPYTSWATAAPSIQDAIDAAQAGETIRVWDGVYDEGGSVVAFGVTNRVAIHRAVTVRAASDDPADTIIAGRWHAPGVTRHGPAAVRPVLMSDGTALIGFTVTGGATADSTGDDGDGGGIHAGAMATDGRILSNVVVRANAARNRGGGTFGGTYYDSVLADNRADFGGGGWVTRFYRGDVLNNQSVQDAGGLRSATAYDSLFQGNTSARWGGAVHASTIYNSRLIGNIASLRGGGASQSTLYNCLVYNNSNPGGGNRFGGGAYQGTLNNCTVIGNSSRYGGGVYESTVINSIVLQNTAGVSGSNYDPGTTFSHSLSDPKPAGDGNRDGNPEFVNPGATNYQLKASSPVINQGQNATWMIDPEHGSRGLDLAGNPRIVDRDVDLGPYEYPEPLRPSLILLR